MIDPTGSPVVAVLVVVDDDGLARLPEVVAGLRAAGLEVDHVLGSVGTVEGRVRVDAVAALAAVAGVEAVEPMAVHHLPPPDSAVQ